MKKYIFLVCFMLMLISLADAGEKKRIELTDGSTVDGEIVSFSDGRYTVMSPSLGTLKIEDSKVRAIHKADETTGVPTNEVASLDPATIQSNIQKMQPVITGNPEIMKAVSGLAARPDFQALLKDPEIMNAAKSMDIKTLMANEKFVKAINDPAVREIGRKVEENK
jgi:hypothetical protein